MVISLGWNTSQLICLNDPCTKPSVNMTFPDPYHEQYWHEFPKHLESPHLDPHGLQQTSHMICQNDPCTKPSVKMTFPDLYHEQYWHEFPDHIFKARIWIHYLMLTLSGYKKRHWSLIRNQNQTSWAILKVEADLRSSILIWRRSVSLQKIGWANFSWPKMRSKVKKSEFRNMKNGQKYNSNA